jgi:AGZA family xanthine/uracil permease-like MFS transporter
MEGLSTVEDFFHLRERGTDVGTEVRAGVTTFMVMVYIVAVNPLILSAAGIDIGAAAAATALIAAVMTILMGLIGNVPIAIAAGLGINGIVAFGLVVGSGLTLAGAMAVIVMEGLVVTVLVLVGLREAVMNAVPLSLKRAIAVGIGLFILFIGFFNGGLIATGEGVPVQFVFPNSAEASVTLIGLAITIILFVRKVPAALLISIVLTSVAAFILGVSSFPAGGLSVVPDFSTIGNLDFANVFTHLGLIAALLTIFTIMLADFFDTMGTATAITEQAGLTTEKGEVPGIGRILLVDSVAATAGGAAGISSNTSYIESAAGVAEGGRTGLTSVVVGLLFLLMVFLSPLVELVPQQATAPVLIVVGYLMATLIKDIDFTDVEEGLPALFGVILMPLTFSITVGIGAAFIAYVVVKLVVGKVAQIHPLMWVVAIAFAVYFAQTWLNVVL